MKEILLLLPEIFLLMTFAGLVISEIAYHGERVRLVGGIAIGGISVALVQVFLTYQQTATQLFGGLLAVDGLSLFFKLFFMSLALMAVILCAITQEIPGRRRAEYFMFVVAAALAMCLAVSAASLLVIFLALTTVNVAGYFLVAYSNERQNAVEAGLKYFVFSAFAAALFVYASTILFLHTGSLNIYEIHRLFLTTPPPLTTQLIVFLLFFTALAANTGIFPMNLWFSDAAQGAPMPSTVVFSLGIPATVFAIAIRLFGTLFSKEAFGVGAWESLNGLEWTEVVGFCCGATALLGALLAMGQSSAKRVLAGLVIFEIGVLGLGLLVLDQIGLGALLFGFIVDLFSLAGVFCAFSFLYEATKNDDVIKLRNATKAMLFEAVFFLIFLASFVGIPPFPGAISKFALIGSAIRSGWTGLAAVMMLAALIALVSFFRLSYGLFGDFVSLTIEPLQLSSLAKKRRLFLFSLACPMIALTFFAEQVLNWTERAVRIILW